MSEADVTIYDAIYALVRLVPTGRVTSYGAIAAAGLTSTALDVKRKASLQVTPCLRFLSVGK